MLSNNIFESRQLKFSELNELSVDNIFSENTASKVKNRKTKLYQKIMSIRNSLILNSNNKNKNNINNATDFKDILNLIKNTNDKISLLNYLFRGNIEKLKEIIEKYKESLNFSVDYNILTSSDYLLDIIEEKNDLLRIIIQSNENLNFLINKMNLMGYEKIPYDHNYIMIFSYFLIADENVAQILKQEINHNKIINIIITNETKNSYIYLFYIYSYIYYFNNQQIEEQENILDSLISILLYKKNEDNDHLLWEIYDLLTFFSKIPKFIWKFYDNYEYIFMKREFYEKDIITIEKLKIINNIFKNINNEGIKLFLKKDNRCVLNLILFSLRILSNINNNNNINEKKMKIFLECAQILQIITSYKDLTYLLLENNKCSTLIINTFNSFILIKENENIILLNEIIKNIFQTTNNIIKSEHKIFISQFKMKNLHLKIKVKLDYYEKNNYINEMNFMSLINIIMSLYEIEKKDNFKNKSFKSDLDKINIYNVILNIILKFHNYENIHNICLNFISFYYPNVIINDNL